MGDTLAESISLFRPACKSSQMRKQVEEGAATRVACLTILTLTATAAGNDHGRTVDLHVPVLDSPTIRANVILVDKSKGATSAHHL
jgi:hypothetical protein